MKFFKSIFAICAATFAPIAQAALYTPESGIVLVDADGVNRLKASGQFHLVEYFADWCGHCQNFAPEYTRVASALQGVVTVAACNDERAVQFEGVKGFPTVRLYIPGVGYEAYNGPRTAEALVEFVTTRIQTAARRRLAPRPAAQNTPVYGGRVITLNAQNFDRMVTQDREHTWFVKFYAPWCGHCKAMAPAWQRLAAEVPSNVLIGEVDATVENALASRYGVQSYPTLKVFAPNGATVPYSGARDTASLKSFVLGYSPAPRMLHMRNDQQFKELCETSTCIVAFLPHILDSSAAERKKYLKDLSAAANAAKELPYKYFWVQAGDNMQLEEQLRLGFGWPAIVAFKLPQGKFAVHRGSFDAAALKRFVQHLSSAPWQPLPESLPAWPEMQPWDGKDGQVLAEQEPAQGSEEREDGDGSSAANSANPKSEEL